MPPTHQVLSSRAAATYNCRCSVHPHSRGYMIDAREEKEMIPQMAAVRTRGIGMWSQRYNHIYLSIPVFMNRKGRLSKIAPKSRESTRLVVKAAEPLCNLLQQGSNHNHEFMSAVLCRELSQSEPLPYNPRAKRGVPMDALDSVQQSTRCIYSGSIIISAHGTASWSLN